MDARSITARERFVRALHGERVDRAPVANPTSIVTLELQRKVGVYFPQAHYELVRPDAYPRFLRDIHRRLGEAIPAPLIFHCCGRTMDRIEHFNENGLAAFHFESANDAVEMRAAARMVLAGNVNNAQTLVHGTPDDVRREVFAALDAGIDIIAPECAVPVTAPLANVVAIPGAVIDYHANR